MQPNLRYQQSAREVSGRGSATNIGEHLNGTVLKYPDSDAPGASTGHRQTASRVSPAECRLRPLFFQRGYLLCAWCRVQEVAKVVEGMQLRAAALQSTHEVQPWWTPLP